MASHEGREALVATLLTAFKTAWKDDYSARSVAEGVADATLASDWLKAHDAEVAAAALRDAANRWERAVSGNTNALDLEVAGRVIPWLRARADEGNPR